MGGLTKEQRQKIINAAVSTVEDLRPSMNIPNPETRYKKGGSTGNLAFHALNIKIFSNKIVIYFDKSIAPYIDYTDKPWIAARWNGKKNPNEGWFDNKFAAQFIKKFTAKIGGIIK